MPAHALLETSSLPAFLPVRERRHPFLNALTQIEYGHMTIITPEGNRLEFSGHKNGPVAYLRLYDWEVLDDLVAQGETGFANAYIDERWDTNDLPALLTFGLMNTASLEKFFHGNPLYAIWLRLRHLCHDNSLRGSRQNIMAHYDLGNDFYSLWLDKSMTYSGALFEGDESRTLEEAQAAKYRRILHTLAPQPGDHILDIGCGWGGFAEEAARHGMKVTGITISEKQADYAKKRLYYAGLNDLASVELMDYRKLTDTFDHVVSIGMFEHVGERYWPTYFTTVRDRLNPAGRAVIQTITLDDHLFESLHNYSGFVEQMIFPGGMLPSKSRFDKSAKKAGLECLEMYEFGLDYAHTLKHWLARFEVRKWDVMALGFDKRFMRLWRFYLASCIASFTSRRTNVMQAQLVHAL